MSCFGGGRAKRKKDSEDNEEEEGREEEGGGEEKQSASPQQNATAPAMGSVSVAQTGGVYRTDETSPTMDVAKAREVFIDEAKNLEFRFRGKGLTVEELEKIMPAVDVSSCWKVIPLCLNVRLSFFFSLPFCAV